MYEYPQKKKFSNMLIYPRMNYKFSSYSLEKVKNKIILKQGEICEFEGYVLEGCFGFYQDETVANTYLILLLKIGGF
jgi:hypothetical protein